MILSGTFTFEGPRARVWEILQDPDVLAKALPGTKTLTRVGEDRFQGVMKVSVGPVNAAEFAIDVALKDKVVPETFAMLIDGKGCVGFTRGTATIVLDEQPGRSHRDDTTHPTCRSAGKSQPWGSACSSRSAR